MREELSRTGLLIGEEGIEKLQRARVAVFGIGGVGGYVVEALARSGVGALDLIDNDTVAPSNLNRQIIATMQTVGQYKVDVMRERILSINPDARVSVHRCFFLPENAGEFDFTQYDYVVDAVDTVTAKLEIIMRAKAAGVPVISCMGAGNKLDATKFQVTDIYQTSMCPLAKVMRRELKKRGVKALQVVYSTEQARKPFSGRQGEQSVSGALGVNSMPAGQTFDSADDVQPGSSRRSTPGSIAYVPAVAGLIAAGEVIKELIS